MATPNKKKPGNGNAKNRKPSNNNNRNRSNGNNRGFNNRKQVEEIHAITYTDGITVGELA